MRRIKQWNKTSRYKDYSYWRALYMSLYSVPLYLDVVKLWRGYAMGYFLILSVIISLPWCMKYIGSFSQFINNELVYPIEKMPQFLIQNGEAFFDKPMPYFVNNKDGNPAVEINTGEELKGFPANNPTLMLLVTKDSLFFRIPMNRFISAFPFSNINPPPAQDEHVIEYQFDKKDNEVFSGSDWVKTSGVSSIKIIGPLIIVPGMIGVMFGLFFIINFMLASIGRLISIIILKYKITFKQSIRLIWVASTWPLVLLNLQQFFDIHLPGAFFAYMALVDCYFIIAVISVKRESQYLVSR